MQIPMKVFVTGVLISLLLWTQGSEAAEYEKPFIRSVSDILPADKISGPHYRVRERVPCDGYMDHFTVDSDFGVFEVTGDATLRNLLREIRAIAVLKKMEDTDVFKASLEQAAKQPLDFAGALIGDPVGSLTNVGKGVASIFESAYTGLTTKRQAQEDSKAEALLALSAHKRDYAYQLGVDVYSSNPVLQKELDRVGWAGAFGSLSFSAALMPLGGLGYVVSMPRLGQQINEFLREQPPTKIRQVAQEKLGGMGVSSDLIEQFLGNSSFTPRHTAVIVANLEELKGAQHRDVFIRYCLKANDEPSANFMMHMAETLRGYHEKISPIRRIESHSGLILSLTAKGSIMVPYPLDYGIWTKRPERITDSQISAYRAEGFKGHFELWVTGRLSPMGRRELERRGVRVEENVVHRFEFMD